MNEFTQIIFGNLDPIEKKGKIFVHGIEDRMKWSLDVIDKKFSNKIELFEAIDFIEYHLSDAIKSDIELLYRVGYFPSTECEMELDHSIKHALIGSYKSSFADLRRALELIVISIFLTSEHIDREKAVDWILSNSDTPSFSKSLDKLCKTGRFKDINDKLNWKRNLQEIYWLLSDFSHNKGQLKGYRELNETSFFTVGTSAPSIKEETLITFCDFYIKTVKEIVLLLSLYNPIILVGLPLDEKFGLNGPASGFFHQGQAELVQKLIPEIYKPYINEMISSDEEILSTIEAINSLPDLTQKDIEEQIKMMNDFHDQLKPSNKENDESIE